MPTFTDASFDRPERIVEVSFTTARIVPAVGGRLYEEVWLLGGPESVDDWNNWVVATRVLHVKHWIFNRIVPWWGEYVHVCRPNDH